MKFARGNMFYHPATVYLVTTNAKTYWDGSLVMGKGAAKEATRRFPGCESGFGSQVRQWKGIPYGVLISNTYPNLGIFQVKYHYRQRADLNLIRHSAGKLYWLLESKQPGETFSLNFPGIGNGMLSREEVLPVLEEVLGDMEGLTIWEK